jgi:hypothetical protein
MTSKEVMLLAYQRPGALFVISVLLASACTKPASEERRVDKAFEAVASELKSSPHCGTEDLTALQESEFETALGSARAAFRAPASIEIPVRFNVIIAANGEGNISRSVIDNQIRVLNESFSGATGGAQTAFRFKLVAVNKTVHETIFRGCDDNYLEQQMKSWLHRGDKNTLNVYTCSTELLGWASYPVNGVPGSIWDGVVLNYRTLPGGSFAPYNLGDTLPHEVGHWMGLEHTFKNGCSAPGDFVSDTAPEASPAFGCPVGRDTCGRRGPDPVSNFMDYSDDSCMNRFSNGQASRMDRLHQRYRTN